MKKPTKKITIIIISILFIPALYCAMGIYYWYNPHLFNDNIKTQLPDYEIIVGTLRNYYKDKKKQGGISCDISKNYSLTYDEGNSCITIELSEKQKECLERICKSSFQRSYDWIEVNDDSVIFWSDERRLYAVMYTDDFFKTRREWDGWYFKRINKHWYEMYRSSDISRPGGPEETSMKCILEKNEWY